MVHRFLHRYRLFVISWVVISLTALVWSLAGMSIDRTPTTESATHNLNELCPFWIASFAVWLGLTGIWLIALHDDTASQLRKFASRIVFILIVACSVRVCVVSFHEPTLSDDIHRYVFDGRNFASGINPYLVRPIDRVDADTERWPNESEYAAQVGHPKYATIYLPTSEYVYGGVAAISKVLGDNPSTDIRVMRVVLITIEMLLIALLSIAVYRAGRSAWWVTLYAWHPLPISEIAASGHQDVIGITFLIAAVLLLSSGSSKIIRSSLLFSCAALVKPIALVVTPFMLKTHSRMNCLQFIGVSVVVCVLLAAPFWVIPSTRAEAYTNWKATATTMAEIWAHFGSAYETVLFSIDTVDPIEDESANWQRKKFHEQLSRWICLGIFAAVFVYVFLRIRDVWSAARMTLFAMVLLTSTAHPWYLLWALAFVPMSNSPALWVMSLTLPWGYAVFAKVGEWNVSPWVMVAAYVPVYAALCFDLFVSNSPQRKLRETQPE